MNRWLAGILAGTLVLSMASLATAADPVANSGTVIKPTGEAQVTRNPGVSVLLCPSDADSPTLRTQVSAMGDIDAFDYIDASYTTPSLATLQGYDVVITYPNYAYQNNVMMGDNLADYVDAGGRVILMVWCTYTSGNSLAGRIMTQGYTPYYSPTGSNHYDYGYLGEFVPDCCLMAGVDYLMNYFRDYLAEYTGTETCAWYTDGEFLCGRNGGNTVHYLNGYAADGWQPGYWDGDWYLLIHNSIMGLTIFPSATEESTWGSLKSLYQ